MPSRTVASMPSSPISVGIPDGRARGGNLRRVVSPGSADQGDRESSCLRGQWRRCHHHPFRSVFLTAVREGETFDALYRLDLQTKAIEKVHAFEDSGVDAIITHFGRYS